MSMAPVRASTRVSIAWSGAPAFEDTDTLVLTINGCSLDLRIWTEGPDRGGIEWATVGGVSEGEGSTPEKPVLRWTPFIDSRPPAGSDEGAFSVLPNGDVLETGSMYNPKTRRVEAYEEVWRRFPCPAASPYCVLERVDGPWGTDGRRAFLGRLGKRALGLAANGDEFVGYRDEYEGGWKRVHEVGDTACLPSLPDEMGWKEGEVVRLSVGEWSVRSVGTTP